MAASCILLQVEPCKLRCQMMMRFTLDRSLFKKLNVPQEFVTLIKPQSIVCRVLSRNMLVPRIAAFSKSESMAPPFEIYSSLVVAPSPDALYQWGVISTICNVA